jgi:membrane protease YdiL (CAAX protease family)
VAVFILGPFLETLLVQRGIINYILKKRPTELLMACLISSLVFAAFHHYSIPYIIKTFFSGFVYGTLYISVKQKDQNAFLATLIAHMLFNGLGFCITMLLRP